MEKELEKVRHSVSKHIRLAQSSQLSRDHIDLLLKTAYCAIDPYVKLYTDCWLLPRGEDEIVLSENLNSLLFQPHVDLTRAVVSVFKYFGASKRAVYIHIQRRIKEMHALNKKETSSKPMWSVHNRIFTSYHLQVEENVLAEGNSKSVSQKSSLGPIFSSLHVRLGSLSIATGLVVSSSGGHLSSISSGLAVSSSSGLLSLSV